MNPGAAEWQMCAAMGKLPGQNTLGIRFAVPPSFLSMDLSKGVFGTCNGYTDAPCQMPYVGFANDDIYYLEVCLFSQVCGNRDRLFGSGIEEYGVFDCGPDPKGFHELQEWLLEGEVTAGT
jgi:hypothetical protein